MRTEHGEIWYFNDSRFIQLRSIYIKRKEIEERCHLGAPEPYRSQYIDILVKHQAAISLDKYDLGLAKNFTHRIHLKDNQPIFRKQFNLPEAHTQFIEQSLDLVLDSPLLYLGLQRRLRAIVLLTLLDTVSSLSLSV